MPGPALHQILLQRYPPPAPAPPPAKTPKERAQARAKERAGTARGIARIQSFLFPVNPEQIDFRMGKESIDVGLLRYRTVSRPGNSTPIEISASGLMLPSPASVKYGASWLNIPHTSVIDPWAIVRMLREWQTAPGSPTQPSPIRVTVSETGTMFWCVITQLDPQIRKGEPGTVYVDIAMKEIVDLPVLKAQVRNSSAAKKPNSALKSQAGENIVSIVKRNYGGSVTSALVTQVYNLNKSVIGSNRTRTLPPGTLIKFPAKPVK